MYSLLFLDKYFLRNHAIWPRFVFDWYFLSRNPGTKIKEPGTSSSFVFLHVLHNISFVGTGQNPPDNNDEKYNVVFFLLIWIFRKIKGDNVA